MVNEIYIRWANLTRRDRTSIIKATFPKTFEDAKWMIDATFDEIVDAGYGTAVALKKISLCL